MDYKIHENGWTVIIDNFDLNEAKQEDVNKIAKLISRHTMVVVKKQKLTIDKELEILKMFKDCVPLFKRDDPNFEHTRLDPNGLICRVTAELNEHGKPGVGANPNDFDWHANLTWRKVRDPIIWLHGERGTAGSSTSYNNNILSYRDLPQTFKNTIKDLKMIITGGTRHDGSKASSWADDEEFYHPLVYVSPQTGVEGMYLPFLQVRGFVGMPQDEANELIKWLGEYTIQDKYVYTHEWDDGDITISDQWHGIHKRYKFVSLEKRVMHRAAVWYPDQDYSLDSPI